MAPAGEAEEENGGEGESCGGHRSSGIEGYRHPIPRLKKDKVKRGDAHQGRRRTCSGSFPSEDPSDSDLDVV